MFKSLEILYIIIGTNVPIFYGIIEQIYCRKVDSIRAKSNLLMSFPFF